MKYKLKYIGLLLVLLLIASCQRNEVGPVNYFSVNNVNTAPLPTLQYLPVIPANAAGVFYEVTQQIYGDSATNYLPTVYAHFGYNINTIPAGQVTCSGIRLGTVLLTSGAYDQVVWYGLTDSTNTIYSHGVIDWQVGGSTASNIPPFSYTDSALTITFNLPDTIHLSQGFAPCSVAGQFDTLLVQVVSQGIYAQFTFNRSNSLFITPTALMAKGFSASAGLGIVNIQVTAAGLRQSQQTSGIYYFAGQYNNRTTRIFGN